MSYLQPSSLTVQDAIPTVLPLLPPAPTSPGATLQGQDAPNLLAGQKVSKGEPSAQSTVSTFPFSLPSLPPSRFLPSPPPLPHVFAIPAPRPLTPPHLMSQPAILQEIAQKVSTVQPRLQGAALAFPHSQILTPCPHFPPCHSHTPPTGQMIEVQPQNIPDPAVCVYEGKKISKSELEKHPQRDHIKSVVIRDCTFENEAVLEGLARFPKLTHIEINSPSLTQQGFDALKQCTFLTKLVIDRNENISSLESLHELPLFNDIEWLDCPNLTQDHVDAFFESREPKKCAGSQESVASHRAAIEAALAAPKKEMQYVAAIKGALKDSCCLDDVLQISGLGDPSYERIFFHVFFDTCLDDVPEQIKYVLSEFTKHSKEDSRVLFAQILDCLAKKNTTELLIKIILLALGRPYNLERGSFLELLEKHGRLTKAQRDVKKALEKNIACKDLPHSIGMVQFFQIAYFIERSLFAQANRVKTKSLFYETHKDLTRQVEYNPRMKAVLVHLDGQKNTYCGRGMYKKATCSLVYNAEKPYFVIQVREDPNFERLQRKNLAQDAKSCEAFSNKIFIQEIKVLRLLKKLKLPGIVETFDIDYVKNNKTKKIQRTFIQKFYNFGSLSQTPPENHKFSEQSLQKIALSLVQGLGGLHSHGIAHKDIHRDQFLVSVDDKNRVTEAAICDFGYAEMNLENNPQFGEFKRKDVQKLAESLLPYFSITSDKQLRFYKVLCEMNYEKISAMDAYKKLLRVSKMSSEQLPPLLLEAELADGPNPKHMETVKAKSSYDILQEYLWQEPQIGIIDDVVEA